MMRRAANTDRCDPKAVVILRPEHKMQPMAPFKERKSALSRLKIDFMKRVMIGIGNCDRGMTHLEWIFAALSLHWFYLSKGDNDNS
jgi:hypothetical protein